MNLLSTQVLNEENDASGFIFTPTYYMRFISENWCIKYKSKWFFLLSEETNWLCSNIWTYYSWTKTIFLQLSKISFKYWEYYRDFWEQYYKDFVWEHNLTKAATISLITDDVIIKVLTFALYFKEIRCNCSGHRSAHLFIKVISNHGYKERKQPQI